MASEGQFPKIDGDILYTTDLKKAINTIAYFPVGWYKLQNSASFSDYSLPSGTATLSDKLYVYNDFTVSLGATLTFGNNPTYVLVTGDLTIAGTVNIGSRSATDVFHNKAGSTVLQVSTAGTAQTILTSSTEYKDLIFQNLFIGGTSAGTSPGTSKNLLYFYVLGNVTISGTVSGIGTNASSGGGGTGGIFICHAYGNINTSNCTIDVSGGNGADGGGGGAAGLIALMYGGTLTETSATYTYVGGVRGSYSSGDPEGGAGCWGAGGVGSSAGAPYLNADSGTILKLQIA